MNRPLACGACVLSVLELERAVEVGGARHVSTQDSKIE